MCYRSVITAAAAVGKRVVKSLSGGLGADSYAGDELRIEGLVDVVNDSVISAASLLTLVGDVRADELESALDLLILDRLLAKRSAYTLELTVEILIKIEQFAVGVNVGVAELDLGFKIGNTCCLLRLVTIYGHIFMAHCRSSAGCATKKISEKTVAAERHKTSERGTYRTERYARVGFSVSCKFSHSLFSFEFL